MTFYVFLSCCTRFLEHWPTLSVCVRMRSWRTRASRRRRSSSARRRSRARKWTCARTTATCTDIWHSTTRPTSSRASRPSKSGMTSYCAYAYSSGSTLSVESNQNVEPKTKNVESKITFLLQEIRKIIKIIATICPIWRLKCTKIQFWLGLRPRPRWWGAYNAPQTS